MEHIFNTNIAKQFGVDSAILLQNLRFWIYKNLTNNKHIYDGNCWTYNSIEAFTKLFPYWSKHQIERIINNAVDQGLIIKGNYNQTKYDRTVWYALTPKSMQFFSEFDEFNTEKSLQPASPEISVNGEMDIGKHRNGHRQTGKPIPDVNTDKETHIKDIIINPECSLTQLTPSTPKNPKPRLTPADELQLMQADNPHEIPEQMLEDWQVVRKSKRAPITITAWKTINNTLARVKAELAIDPWDAFAKMVCAGWQSIDIKYFKQDARNNNNNSDDSIMDKILIASSGCI